MKTNAIISWIDEHGKYFSWVLIVCSIVFLVSCQIIACEHTNQRLLDEEIKYKTSPAALIEGFAKSVFDGFTLGLFSEDGVLTEYKKAKRWEDSVRI